MTGAFSPFWLVSPGSKFLFISCAVNEGHTTGIEVRSTDHDGQYGAIFLSSSWASAGSGPFHGAFPALLTQTELQPQMWSVCAGDVHVPDEPLRQFWPPVILTWQQNWENQGQSRALQIVSLQWAWLSSCSGCGWLSARCHQCLPEPSGLLLLCWFLLSPESLTITLQSEVLKYGTWVWLTFLAALE